MTTKPISQLKELVKLPLRRLSEHEKQQSKRANKLLVTPLAELSNPPMIMVVAVATTVEVIMVADIQTEGPLVEVTPTTTPSSPKEGLRSCTH